MNKTYVWESLEVILTGRTARKKFDGASGGRRGRQVRRIDILHEIEPSNKEDGSWKKWVRMTDLYEVIDESKGNAGNPSEESISSGEGGSDVNWPDGE